MVLGFAGRGGGGVDALVLGAVSVMPSTHGFASTRWQCFSYQLSRLPRREHCIDRSV